MTLSVSATDARDRRPMRWPEPGIGEKPASDGRQNSVVWLPNTVAVCPRPYTAITGSGSSSAVAKSKPFQLVPSYCSDQQNLP